MVPTACGSANTSRPARPFLSRAIALQATSGSTRTGSTARMLSRFKPLVWTVAVSADAAVCQGLAFSYGVHPVDLAAEPEDWRGFAAAWARDHGLDARTAMLVAGPSANHPDANSRIEFMRLAASA